MSRNDNPFLFPTPVLLLLRSKTTSDNTLGRLSVVSLYTFCPEDTSRIYRTNLVVSSRCTLKVNVLTIFAVSDDLNSVWVCASCRMSFAFVSDIDSHKQSTGHTKVSRVSLDEYEQVNLSDSSENLEWQKKNR